MPSQLCCVKVKEGDSLREARGGGSPVLSLGPSVGHHIWKNLEPPLPRWFAVCNRWYFASISDRLKFPPNFQRCQNRSEMVFDSKNAPHSEFDVTDQHNSIIDFQLLCFIEVSRISIISKYRAYDFPDFYHWKKIDIGSVLISTAGWRYSVLLWSEVAVAIDRSSLIGCLLLFISYHM